MAAQANPSRPERTAGSSSGAGNASTIASIPAHLRRERRQIAILLILSGRTEGLLHPCGSLVRPPQEPERLAHAGRKPRGVVMQSLLGEQRVRALERGEGIGRIAVLTMRHPDLLEQHGLLGWLIRKLCCTLVIAASLTGRREGARTIPRSRERHARVRAKGPCIFRVGIRSVGLEVMRRDHLDDLVVVAGPRVLEQPRDPQ